jgi:FkbM family methyltransferase
MMRVCPDFIENFTRYVTGSGQYPYHMQVRTPLGVIAPKLYSHHDIRTVNEIFCRCEYFTDNTVRTVVDIGSNIGISALYFLTRNEESMCYLYEPDERNTAKLRNNLIGFEERYRLVEAAVSYESGKLDFGVEATGRYGGIGVKTGKTIIVDCLNINDVIGEVLEEVKRIDVLKIDTEGAEVKTVEAIDPKLAKRINTIYLDARPNSDLHPDLFWQKQYGWACQLTNKCI